MKNFYRVDDPSKSAFPIEKAGFPFIFMAGFSTAIFALIGVKSLSIIGLFLTLFICFFFRDPDRVIPEKENAVVSPADGKVIFIDHVEDNSFLDEDCLKISIFMSVFNVHVNRVPFSGIVRKIKYSPGKFINASYDKASRDNEHNAVVVETEGGIKYCMVQIAGLIARRIICKIQEEENIVKGSRFGLICFGSRLDVYLPPNTDINISIGEKVSAGTSILGYLREENN
ncbi:MAG: phosphatidylserine decarboxylase family protein [Desulfobacterales bacterium]|nr:phosphatidylserine decarboxylase family protein [Desulfobacterales bacterium]